VRDSAWLWACLFGTGYYLFKGLGKHVAIQLLITAASLPLGKAGVLVLFPMWVYYTTKVRDILAGHYLSHGFSEIFEGDTQPLAEADRLTWASTLSGQA